MELFYHSEVTKSFSLFLDSSLKAKYTVIIKVRDRSSIEMKNAITDSFINCPELIKALTVDNGSEFTSIP
jgi:IS30 family transposase